MTTNETFEAGYEIGYDSTDAVHGRQSLVILTDSLSVPNFQSIDSNAYTFTTNYILHKPFSDKIIGKKDIKPIYASMPLYVGANFYEEPITDSQHINKKVVSYETYPISNLPHRTTNKSDAFLLA